MKALILVGLLTATGALAACAEGPYPPHPPPPDQVRWCLAHHPGYDPNTNMWPDRYGNWHRCGFNHP
jgi:hypothetical protein